MSAADAVLKATGRETLDEALEWIASGYPVEKGTDPHELLEALCAVDAPGSTALVDALRRVAREVSSSTLDSAAVIFEPALITPPDAFRRALDTVAAKCPDQTLDTINANAVIAAQRDVPTTMETLCAVAGLSYSELSARVADLPGDPRGRWTPQQATAAFTVLNDVVTGADNTVLAGAVPVQAYEMVTGEEDTWAAVDRFRRGGVPYEVLLGQRAAGGAWLAHRNRTSNRIGRILVENLCAALDARSVTYLRSTAVGGDVAPSEISALTGCDKQVGLAVLGADQQPAFAVVASAARDSGTASKSASRLARMTRPADLPVAVLVAGPGWAGRNETAGLAQSFQGRLYSDKSIEALADQIAAAVSDT